MTLLAVPNDGDHAGAPVGSVQLFPINDAQGRTNFGVWFLPDVWGTGYATEASAFLIEYGFEQLRLHHIDAVVAAPNDASRALCERLGFVHEGISRDHQFANGEYVSVGRYGLFTDE